MAQAIPARVKYYRSARTITGWTIFFMVLLRVAVGWHFFYEGIWKLRSGGGFSSTPYLMASVGPLKDVFHWLVDDMDGTKKRMTQNYLYDELDRKCNAILRHYGIRDGQGYQNQVRVDELQKKAKAGGKPLTAAEQEELAQELKKLTREQADALKAFVERKKHGVPDDNTVAKLFGNDRLFQKQTRYAGEYVDARAPDKTDQVTVVNVVAIPAKQDEIVAAIKAMLDDLDKAVAAGVRDVTLCQDQTDNERLGQIEKAKAPLPSVKIVPEGAADASWVTPGYVESLLDQRYDLLKKTYNLTERQHQSKYGWRYRDQKKRGHHDKNNVDFVMGDPDFKNDLDSYKQLLAQVERNEKQIDTKYDDQRVAFDTGKKRDGLRNKLLARVEAPLGDIDLQKMQGFGEYIGPIKELTPAQFSVGPVPVNPREFDFPGNLLKQAGFDVPKKTLTYWQDLGMMLGLTVIGACLILGLFTRLAALGGAVMLAMFYLCTPPFPGLEMPPGAAEGHYLFVNKNLIELLVMLMFAFSGIGRWVGLDAFIHAIFGRREPVETPAAPPPSAMTGSEEGGPVFVTGGRTIPLEQ